MDTRGGEKVSPQIAKMGTIDVSAGDFELADGQAFLVKNDGDVAVTLRVKLAGMDDFIATRFECGWNPEIVKAVARDASVNTNLKWGY